MFKTRLLSGILLVIIALATIISGDYVLFFTLLAVSLIGMRELYRAMKVQDEKINLLAVAGYLGAVLYYLAVLLDFERYGVLAIIFGLVLLMFVYVFTYPTYEAGQVMPALFGIVYVAVMLSFIYLTRELPGGKFHVWLIFLCSWGCDTCAYCVGMLIGKHKMAPVLSPKKSVGFLRSRQNILRINRMCLYGMHHHMHYPDHLRIITACLIWQNGFMKF